MYLFSLRVLNRWSVDEAAGHLTLSLPLPALQKYIDSQAVGRQILF
jgi:hypothetical protein